MLKLYSQGDRVTCASNSYRTILSGFNIFISEKEACDDVKTTKLGSYDGNVLQALRNRKIEANLININSSFKDYGRWLFLNSRNRFVYVSCHFISNCGKGRNSNSYHAVVCSDGLVYDSAHSEIVPLEAYTFKYNKKFTILSIILVDSPTPQKLVKGFDFED